MCETQIGAASFAVVYKGRFRGNEVAVKEIKAFCYDEESLLEFEKEIAMLHKFRCEQTVHFDGSCLIPNHIMMVTEFAPCGSLADWVKKRPDPDERIKAKLMLDAAR